MIKRITAALLIFISLISTIGAGSAVFADTNSNNNPNYRKIVFLYTGKKALTTVDKDGKTNYNYYGLYDGSPNRADISSLENNEFVIYSPGDLRGNSHWRLYDSITPKEKNPYYISKSDSITYINSLIRYNSKFEKGAPKYDGIADLIERIVKIKKDAKIWIGLPMIFNRNTQAKNGTTIVYNYNGFYNIQKEFINRVKTELSKVNLGSGTIWDHNVVGFYDSDETIFVPLSNGPLERTYGTHVQLLYNLSQSLKNQYKKMFMWCPYVDATATQPVSDQLKKITYVAERMNIFNYILLQPNYYFNNDRANLASVYYSIRNQKIYDNTNKPVSKSSKSSAAKAIIGVQMELTASAAKGYDIEYATRYDNNGSVLDEDTGLPLENVFSNNTIPSPVTFNINDSQTYNYVYVFYSLVHTCKYKVVSFYPDQSYHLNLIHDKINTFFKSW